MLEVSELTATQQNWQKQEKSLRKTKFTNWTEAFTL